MGYYARREKRRRAFKAQEKILAEKDPVVKLAYFAKDVFVITATVATAILAVTVLQRSFWTSFKED